MSIRSAASRSMYSIDLRMATVVMPGGSATDASKSWLLAITGALIDVHGSETRYGFTGHVEILGVDLNANALVSQGSRRGNGGTGTHERVEDQSFAQGQGGPNNLPQEVLRLQRRMRGQHMLRPARWQGINQVSKRFLSGDAAQTTGPPLAEIILYPSLARFTEEP